MTDVDSYAPGVRVHLSRLISIYLSLRALLLNWYLTFAQPVITKAHQLHHSMTRLYRVHNQLQEKSWPSTSTWLWLYRIAAQKEKYKPRKRKASPLLELPLELQIMIYQYTVSDQECNITEHHHGYRHLHSSMYTSRSRTRSISSVLSTPLWTSLYRRFARVGHLLTPSLPTKYILGWRK